MTFASTFRRVIQGVVLSASLSAGLAMAQAEPTLNQVYAAAEAGKLDQAQVMIQQVLVAHPKSARAYFVRSELFARQGDFARARESLAEADKLAPGLPFAKPEAVQALRSELSKRNAASSTPARAAPTAAPLPPPAASSSWGLPLLLAGGAIAAGYFIFRRKTVQPVPPQASYASAGAMGSAPPAGPLGTDFGRPAPGQPAYGQPAYGQPGYAQQGAPAAAPGMGGRIAGGLATGLAVGAGFMAAEAIGRTLTGNHNQGNQGNQGNQNNLTNDEFSRGDSDASRRNADMGGQNFGVNDGASWDDAGGGDAGSGGDWDT